VLIGCTSASVGYRAGNDSGIALSRRTLAIPRRIRTVATPLSFPSRACRYLCARGE
jgi:hypothetical protein